MVFLEKKTLQIIVDTTFNIAVNLKDLSIHLQLHFVLCLVSGVVVLLMLCRTEAGKEAYMLVLVTG